MKKFNSLLLAVIGLLCSMSVSAEDFIKNGIYYNITSSTDMTVEVTYSKTDYDEWGYEFYYSDYSGAVTIPKSVTYNGCTYSVTRIGDFAFHLSSGLTSVKIPNSVTNIGELAFFGTAWYNNQPDGLVYCGDFLLDYKGTMADNTSISIKEGTILIADGAFYGCSGLTSVEIPNSVSSIGSYAFLDCSGLTYVVIPNSVTSIREGAFYECSGLTSVEIGNSLTFIGYEAFKYCGNLKTVLNRSNLAFSKGASNHGYIAFYADIVVNLYDGRIGDFIFSNYGSDYVLTAYIGNETELVLPENYNDSCYIIDSAFYGRSGLTSVVIPNSVTGIDGAAFYGCSGLTSIEIPNSVTYIGDAVFYGCTNLKTVLNRSNFAFSKGASNHGYIAFYADIVVNYYDGYIGDFIFSKYGSDYFLAAYAGNETELVLPENYKDSNYAIGESVFEGSSGLTSVVIPNSVTSIGSRTFSGCTSLTSVVIPNSVTSIGSRTFSGCTSLTSVEIPNSVTSIGSRTFYGCSGLTSVEIPNSVTSIGSSAFYGCSGLTSVVIPNSVTSIGDAVFINCSSLTSVVIPNSVTSIGSRTFSGCTNLQSITLGNSIELLSGSWSNLQLRTIICLNPNAVDFEQGFFSTNTYNHAVVYVPEDSYWNYAYSNWGAFIHIKEIVTEANSLQSRKAYMIADSKGTNFKVYDAERDALKNVEYTHALDEESEDCCWTVMKENGKTYLYNLGAKKFGVVGNNGAITLSETPVHVTISETESGLSINGNNCMFVLNKHVEVDATGISDVLLNGQDAKNAQIHSLDGRRQQTLKRGVNIVNGKKVFVQ